MTDFQAHVYLEHWEKDVDTLNYPSHERCFVPEVQLCDFHIDGFILEEFSKFDRSRATRKQDTFTRSRKLSV